MNITPCFPFAMDKKREKKFNIICFGFMPWGNMWKRNQSMMAEMVKFNFIEKVIFVNPDISLRQIVNQDRKNGDDWIRDAFSSKQVHPDIFSYTPWHLLPVTLQTGIIESVESRYHFRNLRILNGGMPYILFMNCPNLIHTYPLDRLLKDAALSIFDMSDDFMELIHNRRGKDLFARNIERYAKEADVLLIVNEYLQHKYSALNPNTHVVKNATNYDNFVRKEFKIVPRLESLRQKKKTIIGYSGISNITRIDVNLLDFLMNSRPEWQFVFVGSKGEELAMFFPHKDNFHHLPAVSYEKLPDYLNYFKVAIVPFMINEHTKGNNLLKFHDYLASGKPVVSTNIGGAKDLSDHVKIASTPTEFLTHIEFSLLENTQDLIDKRKILASKNSWTNRIKIVEKIVTDTLGLYV